MVDLVTKEHNYNFIHNKIAVVIMTFNGDTGCLQQCIRGLEEQKNRGYDLDIHILDDGLNPLHNPQQYSQYHYKKTYFDRRCNLNGTACSLGMLIEFMRIARESEAQYVMKVDCDMYIRNLANFMKPLEENENLVIGFKLNPHMNYAAGVTYILPSIGLYNAIKNFYTWYKLEETENLKEWAAHCPEDWAITRCTAHTNNFTLFQYQNSVNPHTWLLAPFNFKEVKPDGTMNPVCLSRYTIYDFVNFGNRHEIEDKLNARAIAANCMKTFIDFDLER